MYRLNEAKLLPFAVNSDMGPGYYEYTGKQRCGCGLPPIIVASIVPQNHISLLLKEKTDKYTNVSLKKTADFRFPTVKMDPHIIIDPDITNVKV